MLKSSTLDVPWNNLKSKYTISSKFTSTEEVIYLLNSIVQDDDLILIHDYAHIIALFKHDKYHYLYDTNEETGEYITASIEEIGAIIFYIINQEDKNGTMSITIFGDSQNTLHYYPAQNILLANINQDKDKQTLLEGAIKSADIGCKESLKFFIENGIGINEKNKDGDSILGTAVLFNQLDFVKATLNLGANLDQPFGYQENPFYPGISITAIDLATRLKFPKMIEFLSMADNTKQPQQWDEEL